MDGEHVKSAKIPAEIIPVMTRNRIRLGILARRLLRCYVSAVGGGIMTRFAPKPKTGETCVCTLFYISPRLVASVCCTPVPVVACDRCKIGAAWKALHESVFFVWAE